MGQKLIEHQGIIGVNISPLRIIEDQRGSVMHMLRNDDPYFQKFGEVYFSTLKPNTVKAWKKHLEMVQNIVVPVGEVLFVLFDNRPLSATYGKILEITLGPSNYFRLQIPQDIWYGFKNLRKNSDSLIANCATIPHIADEVVRLPECCEEIPYRF